MGNRKNRHLTEAFLFSEAVPQLDHEEVKEAREVLPPELAELFPDLKAGQAFIDACLAQVKPLHAFGAVSVKVDALDPPEGEDAQESQLEKLKSTAQAIETACAEKGFLWGLLGRGVFALCLPEGGDGDCREIGLAVQDAVRDHGLTTVTVGAAVFPTADFKKAEIFDNILKALDHAAFFGPDVFTPFDSVSLNISGDKLYHDNDVQGAIREYERALLVDSGAVNVHNSLGVCFAVLGDYPKALDRFDMASQLDPSEIMPVYNTGVSHLMMGNRDKALDLFLQAGEIEPDLFELLLETGKIYLSKGRTDKALDCLNKAVASNQDAWTGHKYLGDCYMEMGNPSEAAKAYANAVKCNPEEAESLSSLAVAYDQIGENPEIALSFATQSIEIAPENALCQYRMASILEKRGELHKAVRHYEKALAQGYPCRESVIDLKDKIKRESA